MDLAIKFFRKKTRILEDGMKLEIKLDPQDIKKIAKTLIELVSNSFTEKIEAQIKTQNPCEKQPAEKVWKMPDGEWWNDKQVAKVTGVAATTLRNWRCAGKGPTYQKMGGQVLYPRTGVLEFMDSFPKIKRRD
jgi:hypothetical protein